MNQRKIILQLASRPQAEDAEIAQYILDALSSWGQGQEPDGPLFSGLKLRSIQIGTRKWEILPVTEE